MEQKTWQCMHHIHSVQEAFLHGVPVRRKGLRNIHSIQEAFPHGVPVRRKGLRNIHSIQEAFLQCICEAKRFSGIFSVHGAFLCDVPVR